MKKLLVLVFIFALGFSTNAQRYNLGFGLRAGIANFLGDIGNGDEARNFVYNMNLKDTRWSGGAFVRYRFMKSLSFSIKSSKVVNDLANLSKRGGKDGVVRGLAGLLRGISRGRSPRENQYLQGALS